MEVGIVVAVAFFFVTKVLTFVNSDEVAAALGDDSFDFPVLSFDGSTEPGLFKRF